jgi:hypothetical protein
MDLREGIPGSHSKRSQRYTMATIMTDLKEVYDTLDDFVREVEVAGGLEDENGCIYLYDREKEVEKAATALAKLHQVMARLDVIKDDILGGR